MLTVIIYMLCFHRKHEDSKLNEAMMTYSAKIIKTMTRRKILLLGAVVILSFMAVFAFMSSPSAMAERDRKQEQRARAVPVAAATLKAQSHYNIHQRFAGRIQARQESDHGFDRAGVLSRILVEEGARVKKGDILAHLDMRRFNAREEELNAELDQAKAAHQEALALHELANVSYERYRVLLEKKHISQQKFDDVRFGLKVEEARVHAAQATLRRVKATLKVLEVDKEMATLTARFDGSIVRRYLDEGSAVASAAPVLRLIEDENLEIQVGLPADNARGLDLGKLYSFEIAGNIVQARLRSTLGKLDMSTRTVAAFFNVTTPDFPIKVGELAHITLNSRVEEKGFWVPVSALAESRRGLWSIYALADFPEDNVLKRLSRRELQMLYTQADRAYVRGTFQDGEKIVINGLHRLVPGQLVRPVQENEE